MTNPSTPAIIRAFFLKVNSGDPDQGDSTSAHEIQQLLSTQNNCNKNSPESTTKPVEIIKQSKNGAEINIDKSKNVVNSQICVHIPDRVAPPRAVAVLPAALQLRAGVVSPRRALPPRVRFGPVQGKMIRVFPAEADEIMHIAAVNKTPVFMLRREELAVTHCDVSDKDKANWLSLLPLGTDSTANVWLYEEDNELYGVTIKTLSSRTPLAIGYSKKYADEHNLPPGNPTVNLGEVLTEALKQWWCFDCRHSVSSAALLQRHMEVYHTEEKPPPRKYRCSYCSQTFSRLFSLKRHVIRFCTKKKEELNSGAVEKASPVKEKEIYNAQNDESRTPSDESFQIYSQGLDFSTNLFDTDRMPNLDMSGSSKSDQDFNPYKLEYLDNMELHSSLESKDKIKPPEDPVVSCVHCCLTMFKSKKRRHIRECTARRFKCECGQTFIKKEKLAQHIFIHHVKGKSTKSPLKKEISDKITVTPYNCDDCKRNFKRRGMLVNHLWRTHNMTYAAVPLEKRIKHYPCPVCPKTYSTAAKRGIHVKNHHPEAKSIRAATIEGESRQCEPAACSACPRQYTTRAKLLQHMRAQHPHLASTTRRYKRDKRRYS